MNFQSSSHRAIIQFVASALILAGVAVPAHAINIVYSGTNQGADAAIIGLIESNFDDVNINYGDFSDYATNAATIEAADLFIVGRRLSSTAYANPTNSASFDALTVPVVSFTSYVTRPDDDRWGWHDGAVAFGDSEVGDETTVTAAGASVFGVAAGTYDWLPDLGGFNAAGSGSVGGGDILATINGNILAAHWNAGDLSGTGATFGSERFLWNLSEASSVTTLPTAAGQQALIEALEAFTPLMPLSANQWISDIDNGLYSNGSNWSAGVAPGTGGNALFGPNITANRAVLLDVNASLNSVAFSNAGDGDYYLAPQTVSPGTEQVLTLTGDSEVETIAGRHWLQVEVAGTSGLQKTGSGELILDHANSFTGDVTVADGRLSVTEPNAIPSGSNVNLVASGANILFGGDQGFFVDNGSAGGGYVGGTIDGVISGAGSVIVSDGGDVTFSGANTYTGATNIDGNEGSRLRLANVSAVQGSSAIAVGPETGNTLELATNTGFSSLPQITSNTGFEFTIELNRQTAGAAVSHTTGNANLGGGTLNLTKGSNVTSGTPTVTIPTVELTSGTAGAVTTINPTDVRVSIGTASTVVNDTPHTLELSGNTTGNTVGEVANGLAQPVSLVKSGSGTWTLTGAQGANAYTGDTTIEQGTLVLQSAAGTLGDGIDTVVSIQRSGGVDAVLDVSASANFNLNIGQTLAGAGRVNAQQLSIYGDNTVTPGDAGIGTLKVQGNVVLTDDGGAASGGALNYDLGSSSTSSVNGTVNDLFSISGTLSTSGSPNMTLNVTPVGGTLQGGGAQYTLISHTGGAVTTSGISTQLLNNLGETLNPRQTFSVNSTAGAVQLQVNGAQSSLTWSGADGATWDVDTSNNWNSQSSDFRDLDTVTFTSGGGGTIEVTENVTPGSTTFAASKTLKGNGGITGYGAVNVNSGTVELNNKGNNYAGTTTIASGAELRYTANATTGDIVNSGTLSLGNANSNSISVGITNGDFEADADNTAPPTGWTDLSSATSFWVGVPDEPGNLSAADAMAAGFSGNFLSTARLSAGVETQPTMGTLVQTVDLSAFGPEIDGGNQQLFVDFNWASGDDRDTGTFSLQFFSSSDGTGTPLGSTISEALDEENGFAVVSFAESVGGAVPSGARSVTLQLDTNRSGGSETNLWLDNFAAAIGESFPSVADLQVDGDLTLADGSTLEMVAKSATNYSRVLVDGMLTADGILKFTELAGVTFSDGDVVDLFDFESASGAFDSLDLPALDAGLNWDASNLLVTGELAVIAAGGLAGDFNGDGTVNIADYTVWRNNLGAPDTILPPGTTDGGSEFIDAGDYALWKNNFGTTSGGALSSLGSANVPEPSSALLLGGLLAGALSLLRRSV